MSESTEQAQPRLHGYLDLGTWMLPQDEMDRVAAAPVRVIVHEYGAWVHVPPVTRDGDVDQLAEDAGDGEWGSFPRLRAVLLAAREAGASWVNFDRDSAELVPGLPVHEW